MTKQTENWLILRLNLKTSTKTEVVSDIV